MSGVLTGGFEAVISVGVLGILFTVGDFAGLATALPAEVARGFGDAFAVLLVACVFSTSLLGALPLSLLWSTPFACLAVGAPCGTEPLLAGCLPFVALSKPSLLGRGVAAGGASGFDLGIFLGSPVVTGPPTVVCEGSGIGCSFRFILAAMAVAVLAPDSSGASFMG